MEKKKIIFFIVEGIVFWVLFFIWLYTESKIAMGLFVFNALIQIPVCFWMGDHFRSRVLHNIEFTKDLRDSTSGNKGRELVNYLRTNFVYFFDNAINTSVSAARLFYLIEKIKGNTKKQADRSHEVNRSLHEMSKVLHDIAEATEQTKEQALVSFDSAEKGVEQVQSSVEVMEELINSMNNINSTMNDLQESTGKINQVMEVIIGISNQTNMLSLNAAIEAAKAGELGKGFAVVADEVRNLANRTNQSTVEISDLVEAMRSITSQIVNELGEGSKKIDQGRDMTLESKRIFDVILDNNEQTQIQAQEVAVAIEEQSRTISTISDSMADLADNVDSIYNNIDKSASTSRGLSTQGEDLMKFILEYKLGIQASNLIEALSALCEKVAEILQKAEREGIQIWDRNYQEVEDTNPVKHEVKYLSWIDNSEIQKLQDEFQSKHGVIFCVLVDENGYLPKHNSNFDKALTGEYEKDLAGSRSRRIFNDFTGLRAGQNKERILLQTYVRDTGEIMSDLSIPVNIGNRHWGGIRVGFLCQEGNLGLSACE